MARYAPPYSDELLSTVASAVNAHAAVIPPPAPLLDDRSGMEMANMSPPRSAVTSHAPCRHVVVVWSQLLRHVQRFELPVAVAREYLLIAEPAETIFHQQQEKNQRRSAGLHARQPDIAMSPFTAHAAAFRRPRPYLASTNTATPARQAMSIPPACFDGISEFFSFLLLRARARQ